MYKLLVCTVLFAFLFKTISSELINRNIERVIDLSSQLVKVTGLLTLENAGKETESSFLIILEPTTFRNLSYVSIRDSHKDDLKITEHKSPKYNDKQVYNVKLNQPLGAARQAVLNFEFVYSNTLVPYPSSITQKERQLVRYFGNHYFYSPYLTIKQTTSVIVNTRAIENYSKLKPLSQTESSITYGPYNDIPPLSLDPMTVHFESNAPFLTVTHLERLIEVSHWGNIAIQENVDILHTGAKLKGPFSRYDYQRDTSATHHSIKSYKTILPASAHSAYYRDSNGNISTSQVRLRKEWIELELRPRYPLFGGWRSSYTLGYSVPSYQYLYKTHTNQFVLRMRVIDNVYDDMHVAELETNVVLPVGVTNVKLTTPYDVERLPDSITYKYLDTKGRPIIRIKKTNLVEQHIQDFEIVYDWQPMLLFHEPILLSVALYLLFVVVIIYVRLDFSIIKQEHVKTQ